MRHFASLSEHEILALAILKKKTSGFVPICWRPPSGVSRFVGDFRRHAG